MKEPFRKLRQHSKRSQKALEVAIREQGFLSPIVVDCERRILAGYGRWLAAKSIGLEKVPIIEASHLNDEQRRTFAIGDNQLASLSSWDLEELRVELTELSFNHNLDLEITGLTTSEIDRILTAVPRSAPEGEESDEDIPEVQAEAITRAGQKWQLGSHRLVCGSSLEQQTYEELMGAERAQIVFGDSPYNVPASMISGLGKHRHADFKMAAGEKSPAEFTDFLATAFGLCATFSVDGSIHYQCMDWRHMGEMLEAGNRAYSELKNLVVWKKHSAGMGSFYRSHHELVFVWKNGTEPHINNFGLGDTGRYRTNVVDYPGNAGFHKDRDEELASHATVKPWSMVADFLRDCSKRGGIVLDPFGGSGTTLIAAERTGRRARLIELDPLYCDVTVRRWQKLTGREAILVETGETFAEVEERVLEGSQEDADCNEAENFGEEDA
ncbi:MAG TPA: DNA methyltransferase [Allosphingosinicella sp.]|nr:DNA methyltransferase [Allosphingosinicella sp.]